MTRQYKNKRHVPLTVEERKERQKQYKIDTQYLDICLRMTACTCPGCGKKHELNTYRSDKKPQEKPARKFCPSCKNQADDDYSETYSMRLY